MTTFHGIELSIVEINQLKKYVRYETNENIQNYIIYNIGHYLTKKSEQFPENDCIGMLRQLINYYSLFR